VGELGRGNGPSAVRSTLRAVSDGHDHSGHSHAHGHGADGRRLAIVLTLILSFLVVEVVVGILAKSVALLADAGHMLVDAIALGLSLIALRLAARPAQGPLTFGLRRVEVLSAQANGVTLLILAGLVIYEGIKRLIDPPDVGGASVLVVAAIGAAVNLVALWILHGADRRSLNIEGSYQHVLMDLVGSIAALIAGVVILASGADRADAIAALAVAVLMVRSAWGLLRATGRVILEAAPEGVDPDEIGRAMAALPGVDEVHDLHVWEVSSGFAALSAHVIVARDEDCHRRTRDLERLLESQFDIHHTTLQVDHAQQRLHTIGPERVRPKD
jgi:cobalt-zinc-cadmium efflux system protein